jgi:hypothetical protein
LINFNLEIATTSVKSIAHFDIRSRAFILEHIVTIAFLPTVKPEEIKSPWAKQPPNSDPRLLSPT